jgi:serine/threonine protein kinase
MIGNILSNPRLATAVNYKFKLLAKKLLPSDWKMEEMDNVWIVCSNPKNDFPRQGFKIHISATILNAKEILKTSIPIIVSHNSNFKFLKELKNLLFMNSRMANRGSSGKFITIYPPNEEVFKALLEELYKSLKHYEGPYILSDMRYKDCKVLYYRYGGFWKMERINVKGERIYVIEAPDGSYYDDIRHPFYTLPPWVKDPFGNETISPKEEIILKERYKVISAIQFSNNGGIYSAYDLLENKEVIIKEARPYVSMSLNGIDAVYLLKKEYEILKMLENENVAPKAYEIFQEWEHWFLVEEKLEGINLRNFVAINAPILNPLASEKDFQNYLEKFITIAENIAKHLSILHKYNIVFGDFSPNNIIINPQTLNVKFIDFEGAYIIGSDKWYNVFTPGFSSPQLRKNKRPTFEDDYYAFGEILQALLFTNNTLFFIAPTLRKKFLNKLIKDYHFPKIFKEVILNLIKYEPKSRIKPIEAVNILKTNKRIVNYKENVKIMDLRTYIEKTKKGIIKIFQKKKEGNLNFAFGDLGVIYVLNLVGENFKEYLKSQSLENYPPGLYVGLSGIAWAFLDLNLNDLAIEALNKAKESPLLYESLDMFYGISGYGLTNLKFYKRLKDKTFLNNAIEVYEFIKNRELKFQEIGYGHGASGVALFLIKLYEFLRNEDIKNLAIYLLKQDLEKGVNTNGYLTFPQGEDSSTVLPYVEYGSAGIIGVLVRFYEILKEEWILEYIKNILPDLERTFTIFPSQIDGLVGLGESLLDLELKLNYKTKIYKILEGLRIYAIFKDGCIFYPRSNLDSIGIHWADGSSGILDFLHRLYNKRNERTLWDF